MEALVDVHIKSVVGPIQTTQCYCIRASHEGSSEAFFTFLQSLLDKLAFSDISVGNASPQRLAIRITDGCATMRQPDYLTVASDDSIIAFIHTGIERGLCDMPVVDFQVVRVNDCTYQFRVTEEFIRTVRRQTHTGRRTEFHTVVVPKPVFPIVDVVGYYGEALLIVPQALQGGLFLCLVSENKHHTAD